jgi:hypothetical protein
MPRSPIMLKHLHRGVWSLGNDLLSGRDLPEGTGGHIR